jgi:MFS family permease
MASLGLYRRLLRTPQLRPLIAFSFAGRLPIGILSLALVLFMRDQTGSFATAGGVAAAFAFSGGLCAPIQGRLVDRLGQTRVLVPLVVVHAAALAAVVALGLSHAPAAVVGVFAAIAGVATPPISACLRPLLIELLEDDEELLIAGYAFDAVMMEAVFLAGPLLTALLAGALSSAAAVVAGAALSFTGVLAFAALPASRSWRGEAAITGIAGALESPGMRTLVLAALPIGVCFGTLEVALPAFGAEHGSARIGGFLLAALSAGSIVGGIAYGAVSARLGPIERAYLVLVSAVPATMALLALPGSVALMVALILVAGSVIAPLTAVENQVLSTVAPRGAATEAFTWVIMSVVVGVAVGNATAGALAQEAGWRAALLMACGVAVLGAALSWARRPTLRASAVQGA